MNTDPQGSDHVVETRNFDVATPLAAILKEVIDYTGQHRQRFGDEPTTGSPANLEMSNSNGMVSAQRLSDIEATHEKAAGICILSAGYLFASFAQLFRSDMALFGFHVVARAIVETSMKAWWLVDPAISIDTRLARLYVDNLTNINEMTKVGRLGAADARIVQKRRRALVERAHEAGIAPKYSKEKKLIGFGNVAAPNSTVMAGKFFAALGYEHGEFWYRSLSAICHGTAYGLLDYFKMVDVPDSALKALEPHLSVGEVADVAVLSMQSYLGAIEFDSRFMGWDADDVARKRAAFQNQMIAVVPRS